MRHLQVLRDFRRLLPVLIASVTGIIIVLNRLFPGQGLGSISSTIFAWSTTLAVFAVLVGVLNVIWQHIGRIRIQQSGWQYSIALLVGLIIPPILSIYSNSQGQPEVYKSTIFQDFLSFVYTPLGISILALLTFFAVSAAIRSLAIGNREVYILIGVALVMLVLQIPFINGIPIIRDTNLWIREYIALAGLRGLIFGASIGAIVACVRVILGLDRPYLDR